MLSGRMWRGAVVLVCVAGVSGLVWTSVAQDMGGQDMADDQGQMSKEQMMQQYMALAEPGPEHEALARMVGTFEAEGTSYCDPSGETQKFTGTQVNEMILGGRYLHGLYEGEMMGQPFQGAALTGYDNVKKKYINIWADTMGTSWMTSEGSASEENKVYTLTGSYYDPVLKKDVTMRQVTTVKGEDKYTFEMYGPNPDPAAEGEEMKMMEIKYTRQKE